MIEVDLKNETPHAPEPMEIILPGGSIARITHESQLALLTKLIRQLTC